MTRAPDLLPSLAEKWEISTDGMTYTFHIRQGVKFSDGTPMTNDDVLFTLDRSKNKKDSPWKFSSTRSRMSPPATRAPSSSR